MKRCPVAKAHRGGLQAAKLVGADLRGCDLRGADLRGCDLQCADLAETVLTGAIINWTARDIIAEILWKAAGNDAEKRAVAGLILISRDWCWKEFLALGHPLQQWALDTLAPWDVPDNPMPKEGK